MLADELIPDRKLAGLYDGLESTLAKIKEARKFVLAREFAVASDGLVDNVTELERVAPFCRLPYPVCWFEWLQSDRPQFLTKGRPVDATRFQCPPHRIGMLCEQHDRASAWKAHLFWSLKEVPPDSHKLNTSVMAHYFDTEAKPNPETVYYDVNDPKSAVQALTGGPLGTVKAVATRSKLLSAMIHDQPSDFGHNLIVVCMHDKRLLDQILTCAVEDWGGEVRFLFAVLGLLNCRNVPVLEAVDKEKKNHKRIGGGKLPLYSHTLLKLHPLQTRSLVPDRNSEHHHAELRAHFVRGHFKQRKSGLYWWSMHRRGNPERGVIEHDYEVT